MTLPDFLVPITAEPLVRLGCAVLFSLALGLERFLNRKPVDFRPFVIIAAASCALVISLLDLGGRTSDDNLTIDPAKVISGVMSGIGFLGAGALFREKLVVQGAGSAASIWASGAIGIICGIGPIWLAGSLALLIVALFAVGQHYTDDYEAGDATSADDRDQP
jgi:putative Mg2+ transporter-C (MgtC) family protein